MQAMHFHLCISILYSKSYTLASAARTSSCSRSTPKAVAVRRLARQGKTKVLGQGGIRNQRNILVKQHKTEHIRNILARTASRRRLARED